MTRRNQKRNLFCLENSKLKHISWQKIKIAESRNLLRIILNIKQEQMTRIKSGNKFIEQHSKLDQEDNSHEIQAQRSDSESNEKFEHFENLNFRYFVKRNKAKLEKIMSEEEKEAKSYPELFERFLEAILKKVQILKSQIKRRKGLCPQKEFIPESSHVCQYCGKKFQKPCSLGGHISKLHSEEKRRDRDLKEINEWQFETPVRRH